MIFEHVFELDHVGLLQGPVDLDLRYQFLTGPVLGQCVLRDDLGSV